jgi:hypothetical protein
VRTRTALPKLSVKKIRRWMKAHKKRTGEWPHHLSGPIADVPGRRGKPSLKWWLLLDDNM